MGLQLSFPSLHGALLVLLARHHLPVRLCSLLLQMCRQLGVAPPKQPVDMQGPTCRVCPAAAFQLQNKYCHNILEGMMVSICSPK